MSDEPRDLRWYQFSLRSFLIVIALAAVPLGIFFQGRSLHRTFEAQLHTVRVDQARMLFKTQLQMANERLQSRKASLNVDHVIGRGWVDELQDDGGLRLGETWDFMYDPASSLDAIRDEIRSCLEPVQWLGNFHGPSDWNWEVTQDVSFDEQRHHGVINISAVFGSNRPDQP